MLARETGLPHWNPFTPLWRESGRVPVGHAPPACIPRLTWPSPQGYARCHRHYYCRLRQTSGSASFPPEWQWGSNRSNTRSSSVTSEQCASCCGPFPRSTAPTPRSILSWTSLNFWRLVYKWASSVRFCTLAGVPYLESWANFFWLSWNWERLGKLKLFLPSQLLTSFRGSCQGSSWRSFLMSWSYLAGVG